MDNYARKCTAWLLKKNPELLSHHLNTICKSKDISVEGMDVEDVEKLLLGAVEESIANKKSSAMKCPKCGEHSVVFFELQMRSADEGASVFYSCDHCLHSWKERWWYDIFLKSIIIKHMSTNASLTSLHKRSLKCFTNPLPNEFL